MRLSQFSPGGKLPWLAAGLIGSLIFAGCSDDPGLQERLMRLQAEMQEKNRQLQEAQNDLEKAKSDLKKAQAATNSAKPADSGSAMPQLLSKDQLDESYGAASKAMQRQLEGGSKNFTVENCTLFPVISPSSSYPYLSKIGLAIRADNGRTYRLEFPVQADASGKWSFPAADDVGKALADSRQQDQNTAVASNNTPGGNGTPPVTGPGGSQRDGQVAANHAMDPQVVGGQAANETRVIDWGDHKSSARPAQRQPPPQNNDASGFFPPPQNQPPQGRPVQPVTPQATPQQSHAPQNTMPSDHDVTIHW